MDCLYFAFVDACCYAGVDVKPTTWLLYKSTKLITHGVKPQLTYGGVAPWMIHTLANHNNCVVEGYHRYFGVDEYLAYSKAHYPSFYPIHRLVIKIKYLGWSWSIYSIVRSIIDVYNDRRYSSYPTPVPGTHGMAGVYLMGSTQHAQFWERCPTGLVYGFYKIKKKGE